MWHPLTIGKIMGFTLSIILLSSFQRCLASLHCSMQTDFYSGALWKWEQKSSPPQSWQVYSSQCVDTYSSFCLFLFAHLCTFSFVLGSAAEVECCGESPLLRFSERRIRFICWAYNVFREDWMLRLQQRRKRLTTIIVQLIIWMFDGIWWMQD